MDARLLDNLRGSPNLASKPKQSIWDRKEVPRKVILSEMLLDSSTRVLSNLLMSSYGLT